MPSGEKDPIARIYITSRRRKKRTKIDYVDVKVIEIYTKQEMREEMDYYMRKLTGPGFNKTLLDVELEILA